jgi:serine/threonine-protein kinase
MALPPIVMGLAVGAFEQAYTQSFFRSFYLQILFWMMAAVGIASYGAHRLEVMRAEVLEARQLGQYRLLRRIGSGGMGEVYLAEHSLLRRPCAIKLIRRDQATDEALLKQFEHEVQVTATLTHPNTVQVFDYGRETEGTLYYVMEYLPGLNLAQLVQQQGLLDPSRAVHILRQLCGALREAHGIGLVHRDVKPGNVIVCERGGIAEVAKLLDFGVVQRVKAGTDRNLLDGFQAGTPAFMSPEQLEGRKVDARSDIYSLGAVAYFVLTGHTPQEKPLLDEMLTGGQFLSVAPIHRFRSDIPVNLQAVIMRCLEKQPLRRFASIDELDAALAACQKST